MTCCRIIESGESHPGSWNMACDEVLLESAIQTGRAAVRVYAWSCPTVSLGYFQDVASTENDPLLTNLDHVRRLSGGGAIVHHHEWTYSCVVPPACQSTQHPAELYRSIHQALIDLLPRDQEQSSAVLALRGSGDPGKQPALCFGRSAAEDVVLDSHKVLGSAQRRRRGAVLQHGSLILARSPHAPQFPGLADLLPSLVLPPDFPARMANTIAGCLEGIIPQADPLTPDESAEIDRLAGSRYSTIDEDSRQSSLS
ncbi:MAG: hypothetical protein CMJ65_15290 [Planctomycetaceae bacterium]|jgi:lipoate-protein ligase A|nr:hypothetical protein [Planctomycetaceae bacterium]MDP7273834.1 hypothetical protein [Planctomycetaceae bacterium]